MGFNVNGNVNPRWLTDNKDRTCNRENLRSVTVTLDTPIPLTWLRVVVSDAGNWTRLSLQFVQKFNIEKMVETSLSEHQEIQYSNVVMPSSLLYN